jgi:ABC-type dipeptide/oligopeptide/nickel transport system ATPase subunit
MDLTISDLTIHDPVISIDPRLPSVPFNMCLYGKSGCGKTNLLMHIAKWYKPVFNKRTVIFTKSMNGSLYNIAKKLNGMIHNDIGDIIDTIMEYQKQCKENGDKLKNVLLIFDDFISDKSLNSKRNIYDKLFSMARHYNISVIITTQQYTLLPSNIRRLAWYNIIYKISNTSERKIMIYEQCNSLDMTENEFENVYKECTGEKYGFIYIDSINGKWSNKFQ